MKKRKRKRTKSSKIGNIIFDNNYKSKNSEDSRVDKEKKFCVYSVLEFMGPKLFERWTFLILD